MFNFFIISGSSLCCVLKALRKAFWRAYISIIAFCWLLDSFADKIKMHRKQWVFSTVYLKDLKIRRVPEFLLYVYVFCIFLTCLVTYLTRKKIEHLAPCHRIDLIRINVIAQKRSDLMQNWKLLLMIFILFLWLLQILSLFSQKCWFFFFRMVKFSLGIWHRAPDCDGNSLLFATWTSNSSWIGVFLCPVGVRS